MLEARQARLLHVAGLAAPPARSNMQQHAARACCMLLDWQRLQSAHIRPLIITGVFLEPSTAYVLALLCPVSQPFTAWAL